MEQYDTVDTKRFPNVMGFAIVFGPQLVDLIIER